MSSLWTNLSALTQPQSVRADVCIIGAGAAGLYLAAELSKKEKSVVLIEAGPIKAIDVSQVGFNPVFVADNYPGATLGRYFGMGGTTSRWGGALVPHTVHDLRKGESEETVWSTIVDMVSTHKGSVLRNLGYGQGTDFDVYAQTQLGPIARKLAQAGIDVQANLYMPFRHKNMVSLLTNAARSKVPPIVFYNAIAKEWSMQKGELGDVQISFLSATSKNRNKLKIYAKRYVIAAGAIESARILLEINESVSCPVIESGTSLGCYLADHLSIPIADVRPDNRDCVVNMFSPRFVGPWMRGFRLLEKIHLIIRQGVSSILHFLQIGLVMHLQKNSCNLFRQSNILL